MKKEEKKPLRLKDVPAYIKHKIGIDICRATIYNWITHGRIAYDGRRVVLRTTRKTLVYTTTEQWVDDFLQEFQEVS